MMGHRPLLIGGNRRRKSQHMAAFREIIGRVRLENRAQACIASLKQFMCSVLFPGRIISAVAISVIFGGLGAATQTSGGLFRTQKKMLINFMPLSLIITMMYCGELFQLSDVSCFIISGTSVVKQHLDKLFYKLLFFKPMIIAGKQFHSS